MIFDDDFLKMTGGKGTDKLPTSPKATNGNATSTSSSGQMWISSSDKNKSDEKKYGDDIEIKVDPNEKKFSSEYGNPDFDYVIESDLVTPVIQAVKNEAEDPLIVCVDDDFDTLDLLEVYLQRDYKYKSFSGPREAIFFLNKTVPEVVLVDCKIHTMRATTFMDIIRAGAGNENTKFVYIGTEEELEEVNFDLLPDYVIGKLVKPVAISELKSILEQLK